MATLNPRAQIALVLAQIEREYSKGMEFFLEDLSTVQNCESYSNYQTFFNLLRNNTDLMKILPAIIVILIGIWLLKKIFNILIAVIFIAVVIFVISRYIF